MMLKLGAEVALAEMQTCKSTVGCEMEDCGSETPKSSMEIVHMEAITMFIETAKPFVISMFFSDLENQTYTH